ncbi:MAG: polysaccharide deacetylase family protein [Verrucomicrobiales bacterium]|nr:polysaccharide deacetylase family protein [Verrucomicrobiales bacterium]
MTRPLLLLFALALGALLILPAPAATPSTRIPDRTVVLTFDDSVVSHYTVVRPLLKELGFGATFFITEGFSFRSNKVDYMTWEQIAELHRDGFEIGNHTRDHLGVSADTLGLLREQLEAINLRCAEHGIPRPVSFGWPGNAIHAGAFPILKAMGIRFARRGGSPEHPYDWGRGIAYEPGEDHPLFIPSAGDARPDWTLADFKRAVDQAKDGRIAVMQFHGVPDRDHPWVHTDPDRFRQYLQYLKTNQFRVLALRDLAGLVGELPEPADPMAVIRRRQAARVERMVEGEIRDAASGDLMPARIYIQGADGTWYFPRSASSSGQAARYERRHGSGTNSVEMHTTLSAHPFRVELPPGKYRVTAERGKEWIPETQEIEVAGEPVKFALRLRRWSNLAARGWYGGDTHVHRDPSDLKVAALAEDVNVVLPVTDWTTVSTVPPNLSDKNSPGSWQAAPLEIDPSHVIYPRNTEYEIFRTGAKDHTLGAFVVIHHTNRFDLPTFPLRAIAERARAEGALIDLEKHNWPWSLMIVPLLPVDLFEIANNHHWRVEYAVRNWAVPAPAWMGLKGTGTDTEEGWTLYGLRTWYALLNCGFRLQPTAGTAHGVHPVPLGFSRVYVHLDGPFSLDGWMKGLKEGRSFVTTGPRLLVTVDGKDPGARFALSAGSHPSVRVEGEVVAPGEIKAVEILKNGEVIRTIKLEPRPADAMTHAGRFAETLEMNGSGWLAVRCWESVGHGSQRLRFAHTAPWFFDVEASPQVPRREEVDWCIQRVQEEIDRNRGVLSPEAVSEYETSLRAWQAVRDRIPTNAGK